MYFHFYYSRLLFAELRRSVEQLASHPRCPSSVQSLVMKFTSFIANLAPAVMPAPPPQATSWANVGLICFAMSPIASVKYLRNSHCAIVIVKWFLVVFAEKKKESCSFQEIHVVSNKPSFLIATCPLFSCKMNNTSFTMPTQFYLLSALTPKLILNR